MEDEKIVELYWSREDRAIDETAKKYGPYLTKISMNIVESASDAEECVNDTYLASWNAIPPHRPNMLSVFLGKLTRRISLNRFRDRFAKKRGGGQVTLALEELGECVADGSDIEASVEQSELTQALDDFLDTIPERQRAIFVRRYWHLEPIADIAKLAGMSESGVKASLRRTRQALREHLIKEGWI